MNHWLVLVSCRMVIPKQARLAIYWMCAIASHIDFTSKVHAGMSNFQEVEVLVGSLGRSDASFAHVSSGKDTHNKKV